MAERPRSRRTVVVGWVAAALVVIIAGVYLVIASPWDDRPPLPRHYLEHSSTP